MRSHGRYLLSGGAAVVFAVLLTASVMTAGGRGPGSLHHGDPVRIVSLAPSVTEILFAIGLGGRVAGVTDYCDYPAAAQNLSKVGGFKGKSLEAIVGLAPDLVIGTRDGNDQAMFRSLERLGIDTLTIEPATLTGVIESIRTIGRAAGREEAAGALARSLEERLFSVHARVAGARPVRVLFVYGRAPLVLAGPGTFADDMIHWAGGENVAHDAAIPYPRFSMESVMARGPEVIVEGAMGSEGDGATRSRAEAFWSRWESLPAVRDHRIVIISESLIARPGPRIFDGLEILARSLHPGLFEGLSARTGDGTGGGP